MSLRICLILLFSLVIITNAAKDIETTIQPNEPTSTWSDRYASLKDLLQQYPSFKYKSLTTFMIRIPADATIKLDQIYSFGVGENVEIVFQGDDRATSKLEFAHFSNLTMNAINLKLSNLSVVGYDRSQLDCFFCMSNGSIDIQNLDIYLSNGPILEKSDYPANFLSTHTTLRIQNVHGVFNGSYNLLKSTDNNPNITIQNSEFITSSKSQFINSASETDLQYNGSFWIENVIFRLTQTIDLHLKDQVFITLGLYHDISFVNISVIMDVNADLTGFLHMVEVRSLNISDVKFEVISPTASFSSDLIFFAMTDYNNEGIHSFNNIRIIGCSLPIQPKVLRKSSNLVSINHISFTPLQINNISASNMIFESHSLLYIETTIQGPLINGISVSNSTIKRNLVTILYNSLNTCSMHDPTEALTMVMNGIEINDSEIKNEGEPFSVIEYDSNCRKTLNAPYLNTLTLNGLHFVNNQATSKNDPLTISQFSFLQSSYWNLIVENAQIYHNHFEQFIMFKFEGPQPIIRFSSADVQNNSFENSGFLCNIQKPEDFIVYLEQKQNKDVRLVRNYRYVLIEKSSFYNLNLKNSALLQGNFINFIFQENKIAFSELYLSSVINLNYLMSDQRPVANSLAPDTLFNTSDQPDCFQLVAQGQPTIALLNNTFSYLKIDLSIIVNVNEFDFLYRFRRFYSRILVEENQLAYLTPSNRTDNNLFKIVHSGNVTINRNDFVCAYTRGVIFLVIYRESELPITTFATDLGKFVFTSNAFSGKKPKKMEVNTNETGILALNADKIQELRYENNSILYCNIIDRGFVNLKVSFSNSENIISFIDNYFSFNSLIAGNNLQTNFLNIQLNLESLQKVDRFRVISQIDFFGNFFISNTIDGTALLTGSLMAVTPSLVQITAPDYHLLVKDLRFLNSQFNTYGYLFTAIAANIVIENSLVLMCTFQQIDQMISSDNPIVGAQGIFFFSSPTIWVNSSQFASNSVYRGSYFVLDNYWYTQLDISPRIHDQVVETISLSISNCTFDGNIVHKGAIIMYSGGYFAVGLILTNIIVKSGTSLMDHFLWISDPRFMYLTIQDSSFEILPHNDETKSSNLFYFKDYDVGTNSSEHEQFPLNIIEFRNCSFYFGSHRQDSKKSPPIKVTFINTKKALYHGIIKFSNCSFLPKDKQTPSEKIDNTLRFEISGARTHFETCEFLGLEANYSSLFEITNSAEIKFIKTNFSGIKTNFSGIKNHKMQLIRLSNSNLTFNQAYITNSNFSGSFVLIEDDESLCTVRDSHFEENNLDSGASFFTIPYQKNEATANLSRNLVWIQDSSFKHNRIKDDSVCLNFEEGNIFILNSSFIDNKGPEASTTIIANIFEGNMTIKKSLFENNTAALCVIETTDNILIENSTFVRNVADKIGVIKFNRHRYYYRSLVKIVENNSFINNKGRINNDYVGYFESLEFKIVNISPWIKLFPEPEDLIIPVYGTFYPGTKAGIIIEVTLRDIFGNQLDLPGTDVSSYPNGVIHFQRQERIDPQKVVTKNPPRVELMNLEEIPGVWKDGVLTFNASTVLLTAPLNWSVVMIIGVNDGSRSAFYIKFALRAVSSCGLGWVFNSRELICKHCPPGQYSRVDNSTAQCYFCPEHAECPEGFSVVTISEGYWANMSAAVINPVLCANNPRACKGGVNSRCEQGYNGLACEDCDYFGVSANGTKYYQPGFYECSTCPTSTAENIVYAVLAGLVILSMEVLFIVGNVSANQKIAERIEQHPDQGVKVENAVPSLRILITYFQFQSMMRIFGMKLPSYLSWTLFIGDPIQAFINSSQCLILATYPKDITNSVSLPYFIINLVLGLIFCKCLLILLVWGVFKWRLGQKVRIEHLIAAYVSLFFLVQPSLTNSAYSIISCKSIDGTKYLTRFPSFQCHTPEHNFYYLLVSTPLLLTIGLLIPGIMHHFMMKKRESHQTERLVRGFGTLINEYSPKYFYWGLILLELKFALITLSNLILIRNELDHKMKSLGLLLILSVYLLVLSVLKPHLKTKLYKLDLYLISMAMIMVFFMHWRFNLDFDVVPDEVKATTNVVIIGSNVFALAYTIFILYSSNVVGLKNNSRRTESVPIKRVEVKGSISLEDMLNDTRETSEALMRLEHTLLLIFSFVIITNAAKVKETTIQPNQPTSTWYDRYASLTDLLQQYPSFQYKSLTTFIIRIPAETTVRLDQNYTFGVGENVEVIFQGDDRATSKLEFTEISEINMHSINLTLQNITVVAYDRSQLTYFFGIDKGSINILNADIFLYSESILEELREPVSFLATNTALRMQNVQAVFNGSYRLLDFTDLLPNITIQNSEVTTSNGENFISAYSNMNSSGRSARFESVRFRIVQTTELARQWGTDFIGLKGYTHIILQNITIVMEENATIENFFTLGVTEFLTINDIQAEITHPTVKLSRLFLVIRKKESETGLVSITNINLTGCDSSVKLKDGIPASEFIYILHQPTTPLDLQNITVSNIIFESHALLNFEVNIKDTQIKGIQVLNSIIKTNIISITQFVYSVCAYLRASDAYSVALSSIEIRDSEIQCEDKSFSVMEIISDCHDELQAPFLNNASLTDIKLININVTTKNKLSKLTEHNFVHLDHWNLFIENSSINRSHFDQITLFKVGGHQPIISLTDVDFQDSIFENSVLVRNTEDPTDFLVYLEYNDPDKGLQLIRNYRYMLVKECMFYGVRLDNTVLFRGNFINFIFQENSLINLVLSQSSIIDLRYQILDERPEACALAPETLFNTSEPPDWFQTVLKGQPTILFRHNAMEYLKFNQSSAILNIMQFDFYYNFKRFYSQIIVEDNRFLYIDPLEYADNTYFNFLHSGNVTIQRNEFEYVFTNGTIFSVVYRESKLSGTTFAADNGKFIFVKNGFTGGRVTRQHPTPQNQTAILELDVDRIQELRFESNSIFACTIIDRGFVNIQADLSPARNLIIFNGNFFTFNTLIAGNNLQTNFLNIQVNPKISGQVVNYFLLPTIQFFHNHFISNIIDGTSLLTGSLMAVTPSLVQITAPTSSLWVNNIHIISSQFNTYGYLFTAIAVDILIDNSTVLGCTFKEEKRFASIDHPIVGAQGIFLFNSPLIFVQSTLLSTNTIQRGSYFVLDNFWSRPTGYTPPSGGSETIIETITFLIEDCTFEFNGVNKGAIIMYSGGYFALSMNLKNLIVKTGDFSMEHFLWISDPKVLHLKVENSSFELLNGDKGGGRVNLTKSNLFYFKDYGTTNSPEYQNPYPIEITNCSFYIASNIDPNNSSNRKLSPPKITFINTQTNNSKSLIKFSSCRFLPLNVSNSKSNYWYNLQFEISGSRALFEECEFFGLTSEMFVLFDIKDSSQVQFANSNFSEMSLELAHAIQISDSNLTLNQTRVTLSSFSGDFVRIQGLESSCTVLNSQITGNEIEINGSFFHIPNQQGKYSSWSMNFLKIEDSLVINNRISEDSTCLRFGEGDVTISNTSFIENKGPEASGTVLLIQDASNVEIQDCLFENNTAYSSVIEATDRVRIRNSTFIRNLGNSTAGAITFTERNDGGEDLRKIVENNTFIDNYGRISNDYVGFPEELVYKLINLNFSTRINLFEQPENNTFPTIGSFYPGTKFGFILEVTIHDVFGNRLNFPDESGSVVSGGFLSFKRHDKIVPSGSDTRVANIHENISGEWKDGVLIFNGSMVILTTPLDWFVVITIGVTIDEIYYYKKFALRATSSCGIGWVYDNNTMMCKQCLPGQYSRVDSPAAVCQTCPVNAKCNGGYDDVEISQGYWANMSAAIINPIRCVNNLDACIGEANSTCAIGYNGPVCEDCDYFGVAHGTRYYQSGPNECSSCSSSKAEIIIDALLIGLAILAVEIVFIVANVISNQKTAESIEHGLDQVTYVETAAPYLRILVTYFQFQYIMRIFNIKLPSYLNWTLFIGDPLQALIRSAQCLILMSYPNDGTHGASLPYHTFNLMLLLFFCKCVLILLIWGALKQKFGERVKKQHLISAYVGLFFFEQPSLVSSAYSIISCKSIDGQKYLNHYPSFRCYTPEHNFYYLLVGTPILIVIGLLIPGVILHYIRSKRKNNENGELACSLGTFISEYEPRFYYWGLILLQLKFVLIALSNFMPIRNELSIKMKYLTLLMILSIYLFLVSKFKPHARAKLCKMDITLISVIILMIFFMHWKFTLDPDSIPDDVEIMCSTVIIGVNILALGYTLMIFYSSNVFGLKDASGRIARFSFRRPEVKNSIPLEGMLSQPADLSRNLLQDSQYAEENSEVCHQQRGDYLKNPLKI